MYVAVNYCTVWYRSILCYALLCPDMLCYCYCYCYRHCYSYCYCYGCGYLYVYGYAMLYRCMEVYYAGTLWYAMIRYGLE